MANVTTAFTLGAQPATGSALLVALGGNGFTAPKAMYIVRNVLAVSDGTDAGVTAVAMSMDPTYLAMVQYVTAVVSQSTKVDIDANWQYVGANMPSQVYRPRMETILWQAPHVQSMWTPAAAIDAPPATLTFAIDSQGTDQITFSAAVFVFDIRARETTPYGILIASATGGAGSNV